MPRDLRVGDLVWYIIPAGPGRLRALWVKAVVIRVGPRLVGLRTALGPRARYVTRTRVSRHDPPSPEAIDLIYGYVSGRSRSFHVAPPITLEARDR